MTSLTIDSSVFVLPPKSENKEKNVKDMERFLSNVQKIFDLEDNASVTVSFMKASRRCSDIVVDRIKQLKNSGVEIEGPSQTIMNYYYPNMAKRIDRSDGVYRNLPNVEQDEKYKNIYINTQKYPAEIKKYKAIIDTFIHYAGFIAELNSKYFLANQKNENYIVIAGNLPDTQEKVIMKFNGDSESVVNIIGIDKVIKMVNKNESIDLKQLFDGAIQKGTNDDVIYGKDISFENIEGIRHDDSSFLATRIECYLSTLSEIANVAHEKGLSSDTELVYLANAHGCLCSTDWDKYKNCPNRRFRNNNGKGEYFSLHFKPVTESKMMKEESYRLIDNDENDTCRIYFKADKGKFLVGWIGKHPKICGECEKEYECRIKNSEKMSKPSSSVENGHQYI